MSAGLDARESYLTLNEVARMFRKAGGRPVSLVSLWRWRTAGLRRRRGPGRARLRTVLVGGTRYTTMEALGEFSREIDGPLGMGPHSAVRSPQIKRMHMARAARELQAAGFMELTGERDE